MKKSQLPFIAIIPVGILSYLYNLISILLLAVIALCLVFLLFVGIARIFRNSLDLRWLKVPMVIIAVCASGVIISLFRPLEQAIIYSGDVSQKLAYAYNTDQADRMTIKTYLGPLIKNNMAMRDSIRLEQVDKIYRDDQINQPIDKFYAAFIFHHSKKSKYFEIAQKQAREAAAATELKNNYVVQWLAKATYDRWMVSSGKPQKYGTQDKFSVSVE